MRPDQNELWERYEDAMFTLLMDEVAHQEGQEQLEWKKQLNRGRPSLPSGFYSVISIWLPSMPRMQLS